MGHHHLRRVPHAGVNRRQSIPAQIRYNASLGRQRTELTRAVEAAVLAVDGHNILRNFSKNTVWFHFSNISVTFCILK